MPLEFALRKRIDLDRPASRRRPGWLRLPPLAVPIGAYWLALVGVFCALRSSAASSSSSSPPALDDQDSVSSAVAAATFESETELDATPPPGPAALTQSAMASMPISPAAAPTSVATSPPIAVAPVAEPAPEPQHELDRPDSTTAARGAIARDTTESKPQPSPRETASSTRADTNNVDERERAPATLSAAGLPSCEVAAASARDSIDFGAARGAPDITREAFAAVLDNGTYLRGCTIPPSVSVEVCAAIQSGKVVGVSVTSEPRSQSVNACVRNAVTRLRFPHSPRLDVTRTRFAASP